MIAVAQQGDTIDLVCWRHFRRTDGIVEATIESNPGIAAHGAQLPEGTLVNLPDEVPYEDRKLVQLWD